MNGHSCFEKSKKQRPNVLSPTHLAAASTLILRQFCRTSLRETSFKCGPSNMFGASVTCPRRSGFQSGSSSSQHCAAPFFPTRACECKHVSEHFIPRLGEPLMIIRKLKGKGMSNNVPISGLLSVDVDDSDMYFYLQVSSATL